MANEGSIRVVAVSTIVSRLTGLLRDMFMYAVFGAGALNSAFIIAFTVPNLFRRFMGEGALTSAVVPVLAHAQARDGKEAGFNLLNKVLSRSGIVLLVTVAVGVLLYQVVYLFPHLEERWYTSAKLGLIVFPYLIFVCLAALVGVALNLQKRFSSAALAQIWVNLSMLTVGMAGFLLSNDPFTQMLWVCAGVLVGGVLQLLLPGHALTLEGWKPKVDFKRDERLGEVMKLLGPGLVGATVTQTNMVISQFLAFGLNDHAVSVLFLANRLMQLPLGVFAVAVTTVTFPLIARKAAEGDRAGFTDAYNDGARLIYAVMIPAAVGLALLSEPVLTAVFKWGAFDATAVRETCPILMAYALAIPLYAASIFVTRGLHSLKDTRTPAKWGVVSLFVNLGLSLALKDIWGTLGLAIANVASTAFMVVVLRWELARKQNEKLNLDVGLLRLGVAAVVMAAAVWAIVAVLPSTKLGSWIKIAAGGSVGLGVYLGVLYFINRSALKSLWRVVAR
jgi:putative peptidoglycan lipid II flippase